MPTVWGDVRSQGDAQGGGNGATTLKQGENAQNNRAAKCQHVSERPGRLAFCVPRGTLVESQQRSLNVDRHNSRAVH